MVEFSSYWCEHPSLFVAPAHEDDPEKRALLVLKWFLSTLKQQHNNKDESGKKKKMKPLNPFLGELFVGKWEDEAGTTNLVAEQVSHHPPATAFNLWNNEHGIRVCLQVLGYMIQSDGLSSSAGMLRLKSTSLAQLISIERVTL
jgi:oxysterol-binding protein-related protein 9/10/11